MTPTGTMAQGRTTRRSVLSLLAGGALLPAPSLALEMARPVRIAVLTIAWGPTTEIDAMIRALAELGHVEGEDFVVAVWFTSGASALLLDRVREMAASGVDIVVPVGPMAADATREAAPSHPIVFLHVGDPVGQGLVESVARPGGLITGVTDRGTEATARRLELFRDLAPGLRRICHPIEAGNPFDAVEATLYQAAAERLGLDLVVRPMASVKEAEAFMGSLDRADWDGILSPRELGMNLPGLVIEATLARGLPTMFDVPHYTELGGLASYGGAPEVVGRQAARMIDRLMAGSRPGEIPVESPLVFHFVINLKVADALGLPIPPMLLYQTDHLIR